MDNGESSLRRYMGGDNEAFGEIVETYYRGLVMFAMRYVGDEPEAENIASDALFELMIKPERYKFRSSLKTYLFAIARNKAVGFLRKAHRTVGFPDITGLESDEPTPEEIAIDEDEKKRLREAVDLLPRDMREAVGLVICGGMSYRDAAAVMGVGTKRVDNLVSRAKKRLKTELSGGDKE